MRQGHQAVLDPAIDGALREAAVVVTLARRQPGQQLQGLAHVVDRLNIEYALTHGIDHLFSKHQVIDVCKRDENALVAAKTSPVSDIEEDFDLIVYSAN